MSLKGPAEKAPRAVPDDEMMRMRDDCVQPGLGPNLPYGTLDHDMGL